MDQSSHQLTQPFPQVPQPQLPLHEPEMHSIDDTSPTLHNQLKEMDKQNIFTTTWNTRSNKGKTQSIKGLPE